MENLVAVPICPSEYVVGSEAGKATSSGVQSLLVFRVRESGDYNRWPIKVTQDFRKPARLMQTLAQTLGVPYLFS
ncbi:MAG: hypothetical protein JNL67_02770 [Planctomycetaceae bacterium]|nr:hypothetical protein [Planctomycetaceae bacterium]